ncbi:glutathione S-transferase [Rhizophagus irregularis DAOM 181602=DAOM 197198]|nr:glutathione S-transferase [Rhizophagus irregularis DAOM 181602=DAOM 197198]
MTITVFGHPASTCTLVVLHSLKELGLSYEVVQPSSFEEIKTPEYIATKHPFGRIPSLSDDGFHIYESRAIIRYLINKYQGTKTSTILIPSDVHKAALVDQFISVETSYYSPHLSKLVYQLVFKKHHGGEPDLKIVNEARDEIADLLHIPYAFYVFKIGEGDLWNKRPNVSRWWKNLSERECWKNIVTEYKLLELEQ